MFNYMMLEGHIKNDPQPIKLERNLKLQFQLEFNYFGNKIGVINCSVWNEKAKELTYLEKGMKIIASGMLVPLEWDNKKTGLKSYGHEFRITDVRKID